MLGAHDATPQQIDDLIALALRGDVAQWPWPGKSVSHEFRHRVRLHGAAPLLLHAKLETWPREIVESLQEQATLAAMWELRHQQVVGSALAAMEAAGCRPLLIKGTSLAYGLYANPALRWRSDSDVIVEPSAAHRARDELLKLGFVNAGGMEGEFVSYQAPYTLRHTDSSAHTIDLHWKINNSEVLAARFTHSELHASSQPLPGLAPQARGAGNMHALLLAAMHRASHRQNPIHVEGVAHLEPDRLIWLYDVALLCSTLAEPEWKHALESARQKGLALTLCDALLSARRSIGAPAPDWVIYELASRQPGAADTYLQAGKLRQQWLDFRALGSPQRQARFARELFFPPPPYMRRKYHGTNAPLPWLYARRAAAGVVKALRRA